MIIIGELINASRPSIKTAIETRDTAAIERIALQQAACGADYIDINAGVFVDDEPDHLCWLVQTVQGATDKPCALDSPNPAALAAALKMHRGTPLINSISLESERYQALLPLVSTGNCRVIALCMSDDGMPETTDDRLRVADRLITRLTAENLPSESIFVDPLVQPISMNKAYGTAFLDAIEQIMKRFPGVHTVCGLSNFSYGLPRRGLLNRSFMAMAIAKGLDSAIVNPLDQAMMATVVAAETCAGRDDFCMNYLKSYRAGSLDER